MSDKVLARGEQDYAFLLRNESVDALHDVWAAMLATANSEGSKND